MSPRVIKALRDLLDALVESQAEPAQAQPAAQGSELVDARGSGLGPKLFRRLVRSGELHGSRVGRKYLVRRSELDRWLGSKAVKPRAKALPATPTAEPAEDFHTFAKRELARGSLHIVKRGGK